MLSFFIWKDIANEIGPILPKYIVAAIISFPHRLREGVKLRDRPTVAVALTVSYKMSIEGASVHIASNTVATNIMMKDMLATATAFLVA